MSEQTGPLEDISPDVLELLQRWHVAGDGNKPTAEALCAARPDLLEEVRDQIAALDAADGILGNYDKDRTSQPIARDASPAVANLTLGTHRPESQPPSRVLGAVDNLPPATQIRRIGHYVIMGTLGEGGMGTVWQARDRVLERDVAIKVLKAGLSDVSTARLLREARAAARLAHPNIVSVHHVVEEGGEIQIVMELLQRSLADELKAAGALPWMIATLAMRDAAAGISAAHEAGMVHRDIKPSNLLRGLRGEVKVVDFGIVHSNDAVTLTLEGSVLGTPSYMAPEQCRGEPADARSDVYSLACTYYNLLTGNAPFNGVTAHQVMRMHEDQPLPDVSKFSDEIPEAVCRIIARAGKKDPRLRYQNASEMLADIDAVLNDGGADASAGRRLCVFIMAASDVAAERVIASRVARRLADEYQGMVSIDIVSSECGSLSEFGSTMSEPELPTPGEFDAGIWILWSKLSNRTAAAPLPSEGTAVDKKQLDEIDSLAADFLKRNRRGLLVYRKRTDLPLIGVETWLVMDRLRQKQAVEEFVVSRLAADAVSESGKKQFHGALREFETLAQFEQLIEQDLRHQITNRLRDGGAPAPEGEDPPAGDSPFRGLEPFEFEHAGLFFGRTQAIAEVIAALREQSARGRAFVMVTGISGGGKSSLVRAGVLPLLTEPGVIEGVESWRRAIMRPADAGDDLFLSFARAIADSNALPELLLDGATVDQLAGRLRVAGAAAQIVKQGLSRAALIAARKANLSHGSKTMLVLVVDQLEEIFTAARVTPADRTAFIDSLSALSTGGNCFIIATLRGDFFHRCQEIAQLMWLKEGAGAYDLAAPTLADIEQMVRRPAQAAGLRFEREPGGNETLDQALLRSAAQSPDCLPLLEFTLAELYKRRTPTRFLTYAAFRELGEVEAALARRAEDVYESLSADARQAMQHVFRNLVSIGDSGVASRRQAALDATATTPGGVQFVEAFVRSRLLTSDRDPDGSAVIRIAHEALLRRWPRLVQWLEHDRELLRIQARVVAAASRWESSARSPDLLLPAGKPLAEARELSACFDLGPRETNFIAASAARNRSRKRLERAAAMGLAALMVIAMAAAFYANHQRKLAQASEAKASQGERQSQYNEKLARQSAAEAQMLLADGTVSNGDALAPAGRIAEAKAKYLEAYALYAKLNLPTLAADVGLSRLQDETSIELATFPTPTGALSVNIAGDGRTALTADAGGMLTLQSLVTGRKIKALPGRGGRISCVSLTPDARFALTGGEDKVARLWDLSAANPPKTFSGHTGAITSLALTPDAHLAVTAADDMTVRLWNLTGGQQPLVLGGNAGVIRSLALSSDGRFAIAADADNTLKLWNLSTPGNPVVLAGHTRGVSCVAITADGRIAISGGDDKTLRIWDVGANRETRVLSGHAGAIRTVAITSDGRMALSSSDDNTLKLWDVNSGQALATLGRRGAVASAAFTPDGAFACSLNDDNTLTLWKLDGRRQAMTMAGHSGEVTSVAISPTGRLGLSGSNDKTARLWDLATGKELKTLAGHQGSISGVALTADERFALTASDDKTVIVWDLTGQSPPRVLAGHTRAVSCVAVTPDGRFAVSGSEDKTVRIWDLKASADGRVLSGHSGAVQSVAITPDGRFAISTAADSRTKLWDLPGALCARTLTEPDSALSIAITPSADFALSGGADHTLRFWDLAAGAEQPPKILRGHTDQVYGVAITTDGRFGLSGSGDTTLKLWDLKLGRESATLSTDKGQIFGVAMTGDAHLVLCGGTDKVLRFWDFSRGMKLNRDLPPRVNAVLASGATNANSLLALGQWYAFRGADEWAVDVLEQARSAGAKVPSLALARCYWNLNRIKEARHAFQIAMQEAADSSDQAYIGFCLKALDK